VSVGFGYEASTNGSAAPEQTVTAARFPGVGGAELMHSRPEVLVGAAFAGGVIVALLLRRLGH
jgi:hypothetical protein